MKKMKNGSVLINVSRGKIINENDIHNILEIGTAIGYSGSLMLNSNKYAILTTIEKNEKSFEKAKEEFIKRRKLLKKEIPDVITPITIFETGMEIPASNTGKLTHTYIDEPFSAKVIDYKGNISTVSERSCVHLEDAEFHLSIAKAYADYLNGIESDIYE